MTADVLLPRAVACVAEAKVPHLRAELAYVDAFARDDVLLGAEGYALTTLSCALDVLADGDDSGEQPVLDLGERAAAPRWRFVGEAAVVAAPGCGAPGMSCHVVFFCAGGRATRGRTSHAAIKNPFWWARNKSALKLA